MEEAMKTLGLNPYLPFWETVPDGEPHEFGGRIYIYGSHDTLGGSTFCDQDYVCWSAPVEDPGNWRYEGVIYSKMQDPLNGAPYDSAQHGGKKIPSIPMPFGDQEHPHYLYAPDLAQGPDGRFYLYYALDFVGVISVAVSDSPAGPFEFLDFVTYEDGRIPEEGIKFDPGILSEPGGNYLYYGFAPQFKFPGQGEVPGALMVQLADDMHTIITDPLCVANGFDTAKGTDYEEHPFFEASSIRHYGDWYYFVYSSLQGNELCYGMSRTPGGHFDFKGVIVSNGDLGYKGNTLPTNYMGNNHGGLVQAGDKFYIFWHRHINGTQYSRQGCANEVHFAEDGTIPQIEVTSCGLNGGPLPARGVYQTYIACHLTEADRTKVGNNILVGPGEPVPPLPEGQPYITTEPLGGDAADAPVSIPAKICTAENGGGNVDIDSPAPAALRPLIANLRAGSVAGFKYFAFDGKETTIRAMLRGEGILEVRADAPDGQVISVLQASSGDWTDCTAPLMGQSGTHALYFRTSEGKLDFAEFELC